MADVIQLEGVLSKGYGTIPKLVMKDENLTIEAKGIYAYLCSYAGAGLTAFPGVELICNDLGISDNRFYKHRKLLEENGYIKIDRVRQDKGFSKNIYTICSTVHLQNEGIRDDSVYPQNVGIQNVDIGNVDIGNEGTNNNSLNNNIFNNNNINKDNNNSDSEIKEIEPENPETQNPKTVDNKSVHLFYQQNINAMETTYIAQQIEYWIEDLGAELVLEALQRAVKYNAEFGYAERIMKNWEKKGIDSLEKVEQADAAFEQQNQKRYGTNNKTKQINKSKLPDFINPDYNQDPVDEQPVDTDTQESYSDRLARLRANRLKNAVE